ncbi:TonB-dependent receptor [Sphingomonas sp. ID0503]|uniref:TonB-dependent receptor n=1 Tax=Sphingomonas sp. ID0503 TaxID=3399691 RepID=UPI003AFB0393
MKLFLTAASVAALSVSFMAHADEAAVEAPAAEAPGDEIIVTATKRETNLQDTPIAISVVSTQAIQDRHIQSLLDFADGSVPGLRVATFEARQSALTIGIRGIVPLDANQPAREQGVGVYIDGVYLGRQHGLNAALFDIERIEVLKGPQGTLFGRNTEGGALSLVTKKPSGELGFRGKAGIGNLGQYTAEGHLDLPEFHNISIKADGVIQHRNSVTKNPLPSARGWGYYDRKGFKLSARWKPSADFTADYSYDYGNDHNTPFYSQLLNYNVQGKPVGTTFPLPSGTIAPLPPIVVVEGDKRMKMADIGVPQQDSVDKTFGHTLTLAYDLSDKAQLRSITAYREVEVEQWDNAGGAHRPPVFAPNGNFSRYSLAGLWQDQFSQELQLVGSTDNLDYVAGLYYFHEKVSDDAATPSTNRWNEDGTGYTINDPTNTIRGNRFTDRASRAKADSWAVYGQATYTPALLDEALHLTVGGRYTHDKKSGDLFIVNNAPTDLSFDFKKGRFDPMVTLAFDAAQDINLYAKFATGYRAGGASSRSLTYRSFGPEKVKSYEIGAKTELFDRRLRLNLAGFIMDRTGSQIDFSLVTVNPVTGSSRNTLETINAPGTTKIRGVEAEATLRVAEGLTINGAYAYTYTKIPDTINPFSGTLQSVYIVFTPRNTASGAIDYTVPVGVGDLRFHLDANYADATQTFDQFEIKNDKSFLMNGRIALADIDMGRGDAKLTVALWGRNLLDKDYVYRRDPSNRGTLGDYGNFNEPRTYGVEAAISF